MKAPLDHQKLDVYKAAIEFVALADTIANELPRGRGYLVDQLRRAATSIALNIAEGAGEFSQQDKSRFYRMARRSATECAAVLDVCRCLDLLAHNEIENENGYTLLQRIISMLTKLAQVTSGTGTGTGTGTGINATPA